MLAELDLNLIVIILHFLDLTEISELKTVCKLFNNIINETTWNFIQVLDESDVLPLFKINHLLIFNRIINQETLKHINTMNVSNVEFDKCVMNITDDDFLFLNKLKYLRLHKLREIQFTGDGFKYLKKCKEIVIDSCNLKSYQCFRKLQCTSINIMRNNITDNDLNFINFQYLESLSLIKCLKLKSALNNINNLANLKKLHITMCPGVAVSINHIVNYGNLTCLYLSANDKLTETMFEKLYLCQSLSKISLKCYSLVDKHLYHISQCKFLKQLYLNSGMITNTGIKHLENLELEILRLYNFDNITDDALKFIKNIPAIDLHHVNITGYGFQYLDRCRKLGLVLDDILIDCLKYLDKIDDLTISECSTLTDNHLQYLHTCPLRKSLQLFDCPLLTQKGLVFIGKCEYINVIGCGDIETFELMGSYSVVLDGIMEKCWEILDKF